MWCRSADSRSGEDYIWSGFGVPIRPGIVGGDRKVSSFFMTNGGVNADGGGSHWIGVGSARRTALAGQPADH